MKMKKIKMKHIEKNWTTIIMCSDSVKDKNEEDLYVYQQIYFNEHGVKDKAFVKYYESYSQCLSHFTCRQIQEIQNEYVPLDSTGKEIEKKEKEEKEIEKKEKKAVHNPMPILAWEFKSGKKEFVGYFNSQREAERKLNISQGKISSCVRGLKEKVQNNNGEWYYFQSANE